MSTTTAIDASPVIEFVGVVTGKRSAGPESSATSAGLIQIGQASRLLVISASGTAVKLWPDALHDAGRLYGIQEISARLASHRSSC